MILQLLPSKYQTALFGGLLTTSFIGLVLWLRRGRKSKHRSTITLKMIPALEKPSVHIQDPETVEHIINNMIQDGAEHLQVITDFDRTLSGYCMNGEIVDTCHQALDNSTALPSGYRESANLLRDHYYPIEIDPQLTIQEKIPYMVEWWTKAHNLLVQASLTRSSLKTIVAESNIQLRSGCLQMFEELHQHQVPLLIFSAGVGDIIVEVISQRGKLYDNMKIVSNYMDFNGQGELVGFQSDLIHTFNKNKTAIQKSDYFNSIKHRHNIILLGDSTGDLTMAEGAYNIKNILKIGFLNTKIEESLDTYKKLFDIVLVRDETMDIPIAILKKIL